MTGLEGLEFLKVEGLGNDFVLIDLRTRDENEAMALRHRLMIVAAELCDRHRGIGADGLLLIGRGSPAQAGSMVVINADGSRPEMCGNGLRCVALYLAQQRCGPLEVGTEAGPRPCVVDPARGWVHVDMGPATHEGLWSPPTEVNEGPWQRWSLGNPHAVTVVPEGLDPEDFARTRGASLSTAVPGGTNVEFVRVAEDGSLVVWVYERGCGITQACGTGACAAAADAVSRGLVAANTPIRVRLPGGVLEVVIPAEPQQSVTMAGPARIVFAGIWRGGSTPTPVP